MWTWSDLGGVYDVLENGVVVGRVYHETVARKAVEEFNSGPSMMTGVYRLREWIERTK